ncbi:lytic murein transglycosylase [Anianabacter salinae]|uniref:lytic murein transglycosylase n=1 Tax=Anianabacter salinae TaxID=2851023 RepID=UPI00225DD087|nr:lytic murein transglycosylase [Anianabacter salinae]MBV0911685.1 lytic murein transglycosylase [Anianabacter salinae]
MRITLFAALLSLLPAAGIAASCGNTASGFEAWKSEFAPEAQRAGVGASGLAALKSASYSQGTISADRNQTGVRYSLSEFKRIRGTDAIARIGRQRKAQSPDFYAALERIYGVPSGVLLAIHGMETGFGNTFGGYNVVSSIATVAYDCRRAAFFRPHLVAALKMIDRGWLEPGSIGAAHGEIGHTQFLPGNVIEFGRDGNGDGTVDLYNLTDSLASTAHFLRQKGWRSGQPYDEGTHNFRVLNEWNAATVYQQAIALTARQIDG